MAVKVNLERIAFGRTELGQKVYDVYFSSLSAAEVARRHKGLRREWILQQRNSKLGRKLKAQITRTKKERSAVNPKLFC